MLRFIAIRAEREGAVVLEPRFEVGVEPYPRLSAHQHAWRPEATRADILDEEGVDRTEGIQTKYRGLVLDQRPEGDRARIAPARGMLVFEEQPEIGPVLALRRQLQEAFQGRRIVVEA